ncbi:hypothetical protein [Leuconostoc pseudomesenteroides]|uniref:hypothetical protein n=1 Tax=Leuconostoc pseudomesenteroides TaxID=33968 RepID=UPI0039ED2BA2
MSLLKRDNFTLGQINEDVEYVIVSTNKPVMAVQYSFIKDSYKIIYMTQDKLLKKNNKSMFVKEFIGGESTVKEIKKVLDNDISVLSFMNSLKEKKRTVKVNSKIFPVEIIDSLKKFLKFIPENDIFLKDMPLSSSVDFQKIFQIIEYEDKHNKEFGPYNSAVYNDPHIYVSTNLDEEEDNAEINSELNFTTYDDFQQIPLR